MSEVKHTPGPWGVGAEGAGYPVNAAQPKWHGGGKAICACRPANRTSEAYAEARANARLIAAAPDLLAVAQMVLDTASDTTPPELLAAATAAVAKAEGR